MALFKRGKYYYTRFQIKGHKVYESTKCTKLAEAKQYEKNLKSSFKLKPTGRTFDDACARWIQTDAPKSMYSHINQTLIYMENSLLIDSVKDAADMKFKLIQKGLNPQTINRRLSVVRRVLNVAYKEYEMLDMPLAEKISPMMLSEKEYQREVFLTAEQVKILFSHIPEPRLKHYFIALVASGLRRSELENLEPQDYVNHTVRLTSKTKGKRPRIVPIPEWAQESFKSLPIPVTYDQVRYAFEKARKSAEMPHVRMHDLRHTLASWLALDPLTAPVVIRNILGHSTMSTTDKYMHLREDALVEAMNRIKSIL